MKKTRLTVRLTIIAVLLGMTVAVCAGCGSSKKQKALGRLCDNLMASYSCELTYSVTAGDTRRDGNARLIHEGATSRIDILSPEPLTGLSVEYDVAGAPSGIAVHFAGIDTTLPSVALSRVNKLSALSADDFVSTLSKVSADKITEYQPENADIGYFASINYGNAEITVCFSESGDMPYSLQYVSDDLCANIVFTKYKQEILTAD